MIYKALKFFLSLLFIFSVETALSKKCTGNEPPRGGRYKGWRILVHGNWCGKGYKGRKNCTVDKMDAACKAHDLCEYRNVSKGKDAHSCACDLQFLRDIENISSSWRGTFKTWIRGRNSSSCLSRL